MAEKRAKRQVVVRVDADVHDRWTEAAKRRSVSLNALILDAVERDIAPVGRGSSQASKRVTLKGAAGSPSRRGVCARERFHRSGTYCKECGKTTP